MNTAVKYASENGVEALKEALPASFKPSANELINDYGLDNVLNLDDLRAAIADHDRTDHVTDIRNHISPMTIVQGD